MNPDNPQQFTQPNLQQKTPEKVIQPTSNLEAHQIPGRAPIARTENVYNAPTSDYDPTSDSGYRVPSLGNSDSSGPDLLSKPLAFQHKSLLLLVIYGFLTSIPGILYILITNPAAHYAGKPEAQSIIQTVQTIILLLFVLDVLINVFLLTAKSPHGVMNVLKLFIVLDFIAAFGVFWGFGGGSLIAGVHLIYTYIVYNIIKTGRTV